MSPVLVQLEVVLELHWFVSILKYSSGMKKLIQSRLKTRHEFMWSGRGESQQSGVKILPTYPLKTMGSLTGLF